MKGSVRKGDEKNCQVENPKRRQVAEGTHARHAAKEESKECRLKAVCMAWKAVKAK